MATDALQVIEKRVTLRASRSRVWQALTRVDEFCRWFGVFTAEGAAFVPGARLHLRSVRGNPGEDFHMFVEQVMPETLFSWRWHPGVRDTAVDYSAEPTTLVVFTLRDLGLAAPGRVESGVIGSPEMQSMGTELTVIESGFNQISLIRRAQVYHDNDVGWTEQLRALAGYVDPAL